MRLKKNSAFLIILLAPLLVSAQSVYLCTGQNGSREFKNVGTAEGCEAVRMDAMDISSAGSKLSKNPPAKIGKHPKRWSYLAHNATYSEVWIDSQSTSNQKNGARVWVMTDTGHQPTKIQDRSILSELALYQIGCADRSATPLQVTSFGGAFGDGGEIAKREETAGGAPNVAKPDSVLEALVERICKR